MAAAAELGDLGGEAGVVGLEPGDPLVLRLELADQLAQRRLSRLASS